MYEGSKACLICLHLICILDVCTGRGKSTLWGKSKQEEYRERREKQNKTAQLL